MIADFLLLKTLKQIIEQNTDYIVSPQGMLLMVYKHSTAYATTHNLWVYLESDGLKVLTIETKLVSGGITTKSKIEIIDLHNKSFIEQLVSLINRHFDVAV